MSPEPNPKTEALLKAYAEKRRAQAGDTRMHGATRKLLQGEVRRQYPRGGPGSRRSWLQLFMSSWPRLALASAIVLSIGIGLWSVRDRSEFQMARHESEFDQKRLMESAQGTGGEVSEPREPSLALKEKALLAPATPSADSRDRVVKAEDSVVRENLSFYSKEAKDAVKLGTAPEPASAPAASDESSRARGVAVVSKPLTDSIAGGSKPPSPPAPTPLPADALAPRLNEASISQTREGVTGNAAKQAAQNYFRNVAVTEAESIPGRLDGLQAEASRKQAQAVSASSSVLSSFQVDQSGGAVRIVDADGSIYEGRIAGANLENAPSAASPTSVTGPTTQEPVRIEATSRLERRSAVAQSAGALPDQKAQTVAQSATGHDVGFEVFGTNRSLKKTVSLTGSLVMASNQTQILPSTPAQGLAGASQLQRPAQRSAQNTSFTNSTAPQQVLRVIGRAKLDGTNELIIDAVPDLK